MASLASSVLEHRGPDSCSRASADAGALDGSASCRDQSGAAWRSDIASASAVAAQTRNSSTSVIAGVHGSRALVRVRPSMLHAVLDSHRLRESTQRFFLVVRGVSFVEHFVLRSTRPRRRTDQARILRKRLVRALIGPRAAGSRPAFRPLGSRNRIGFAFRRQPHSVVFSSWNSNSSTLRNTPNSGLHCLARTSYVPPATGENHRPFHLSGCVMLDVSSSVCPKAE